MLHKDGLGRPFFIVTVGLGRPFFVLAVGLGRRFFFAIVSLSRLIFAVGERRLGRPGPASRVPLRPGIHQCPARSWLV
jgi:hypothetical protein